MMHADIYSSRAVDFAYTGLNPIYDGVTVVILLVNRQDVIYIVVSIAVLLNPS